MYIIYLILILNIKLILNYIFYYLVFQDEEILDLAEKCKTLNVKLRNRNELEVNVSI